jgi:GDP-D-mannose dehydratase
MSKTIEIISIHKGPIAITTRGESRTVEFEAKGDVGIAMCDNDEAGVFLKIGLPDYWKAGAKTDAVQAALANDPEAAAAAAKLLNGGKEDTDADKQTVKEIVELLQACNTPEEVDALVEGDPRKGVIKAAEDRKKELAE